ncbi:MAG: ParB/RepB/Spo0J family partition protein [Clostridia bacterium]|nr:ParB/RepB/Spo0J family partition protein [Clostridia bacterium]
MVIQKIELSKLHPYEGNPFRVTDDDQMEMLVDSIKAKGIIEPLIVRPDGSGEYEIISGHRRFHASKKLGIDKVPCFVSELSREDAVIILVDSNLYRDGLLPSEKAFAFRMKNEALFHQGKRSDLTSRQVGEKLENEWSINRIANTVKDSERTIQRYIRLTYMIPELIKMVDEKKMAITPAVEISYIPQELQKELLVTVESEQAVPSLSQAQRMRKLSGEGKLDADMILEIMCERKANQRESLKLPPEVLGKYFRADATPKFMTEIIDKALAMYAEQQRAKIKRKDYGAR